MPQGKKKRSSAIETMRKYGRGIQAAKEEEAAEKRRKARKKRWPGARKVMEKYGEGARELQREIWKDLPKDMGRAERDPRFRTKKDFRKAYEKLAKEEKRRKTKPVRDTLSFVAEAISKARKTTRKKKRAMAMRGLSDVERKRLAKRRGDREVEERDRLLRDLAARRRRRRRMAAR